MAPRAGSSARVRAAQPPAGDLAELFSQLTRLENQLWASIDADLKAEHGLSLGKFEAMRIMERQGPCRVYDIASALSLTTGGTSKLVDTIEASGHCRRRPNPDDRRSSLIELTASGRKLMIKANRTFERSLQDKLGQALGQRSLDQFTASVRMLRAAAAAADEPSR